MEWLHEYLFSKIKYILDDDKIVSADSGRSTSNSYNPRMTHYLNSNIDHHHLNSSRDLQREQSFVSNVVSSNLSPRLKNIAIHHGHSENFSNKPLLSLIWKNIEKVRFHFFIMVIFLFLSRIHKLLCRDLLLHVFLLSENTKSYLQDRKKSISHSFHSSDEQVVKGTRKNDVSLFSRLVQLLLC